MKKYVPRRYAPHELSAIDPEKRRGVCCQCGPVRIEQHGRGYWRCCTYASEARRHSSRTVRLGLLDAVTCTRCGFVPVDMIQIQVHHRDRNRKNNDPANLEALCANCHVLEHAKNRTVPRSRTGPKPEVLTRITLRLAQSAWATLMKLAGDAEWAANWELRAAIEHWLDLPVSERRATRAQIRKRDPAHWRSQARVARFLYGHEPRQKAQEWIELPEENKKSA